PANFGDLVEVEVLTGLEALGRQVDVERITGALQILAPIPGALERLRMDSLIELVFRGFGVDLQELVLSAEEMQEKRQAEQAQMLQAQAGEQAISTAGAVVESAAAQPAPAAA
ncbi:MAG TPA: hypothetical protein VM223_04585, partial [Planctomycetota bacterium]|nr:hypothetical protein [Planctomycetota bacterium]